MLFDPDKCDLLHSRNIHIDSYIYDQDAIALEGRLTDDRRNQVHNLFGEARPPGTVHDLVIRMIVRGPKLLIEDLEVEMLTVPNPDCREALASLLPLKGESITAGFTAKVHRLVGGIKGCAHLVALSRAMASAAVQGAWAALSSRPPAERKLNKRHLRSVINTCHLWRSDGPLIQKAQDFMKASKP